MVALLTAEDSGRVRDAIRAAELKTSGEIRVLVVSRSTLPDPWFGSLATAVVGVGAWLWLRWQAWGYPGATEMLLAAGVGLAAGIGVALIVPRVGKRRAVRRRAEREFARLGIAKTAGRTGMLLMMSVAEREAVLLADRAIHEKVAPGTWDGIVGRVVAAIHEGRSAEGVVDSVRAVGELLAQHFPRRRDDVNELSDDVEAKR